MSNGEILGDNGNSSNVTGYYVHCFALNRDVVQDEWLASEGMLWKGMIVICNYYLAIPNFTCVRGGATSKALDYYVMQLLPPSQQQNASTVIPIAPPLSIALNASQEAFLPMRFTQPELDLFRKCNDFITTNPAKLSYYQKIQAYCRQRDAAKKQVATPLQVFFLPLFEGDDSYSIPKLEKFVSKMDCRDLLRDVHFAQYDFCNKTITANYSGRSYTVKNLSREKTINDKMADDSQQTLKQYYASRWNAELLLDDQPLFVCESALFLGNSGPYRKKGPEEKSETVESPEVTKEAISERASTKIVEEKNENRETSKDSGQKLEVAGEQKTETTPMREKSDLNTASAIATVEVAEKPKGPTTRIVEDIFLVPELCSLYPYQSDKFKFLLDLVASFMKYIDLITGFLERAIDFCSRENLPISDSALIKQVFTASSFDSFGQQNTFLHNECLEFLGDAVLDFVVTANLFRLFPFANASELTDRRSDLISNRHLRLCGATLNLQDIILHNQATTPVPCPLDLVCDQIEALIGALYLEKGLPQCVEFIYKHVWIDGRDGERVTPAPEGPLIAPDKMAGPVFSQDWIAKFLDPPTEPLRPIRESYQPAAQFLAQNADTIGALVDESLLARALFVPEICDPSPSLVESLRGSSQKEYKYKAKIPDVGQCYQSRDFNKLDMLGDSVIKFIATTHLFPPVAVCPLLGPIWNVPEAMQQQESAEHQVVINDPQFKKKKNKKKKKKKPAAAANLNTNAPNPAPNPTPSANPTPNPTPIDDDPNTPENPNPNANSAPNAAPTPTSTSIASPSNNATQTTPSLSAIPNAIPSASSNITHSSPSPIVSPRPHHSSPPISPPVSRANSNIITNNSNNHNAQQACAPKYIISDQTMFWRHRSVEEYMHVRRALLTRNENLALLSGKLNLLQLSKEVIMHEWPEKTPNFANFDFEKVEADLLSALIGAIYIAGGLQHLPATPTPTSKPSSTSPPDLSPLSVQVPCVASPTCHYDIGNRFLHDSLLAMPPEPLWRLDTKGAFQELLQLPVFNALPRCLEGQNRAPRFCVLETHLSHEVPLLMQRLRQAALLSEGELETIESKMNATLASLDEGAIGVTVATYLPQSLAPFVVAGGPSVEKAARACAQIGMECYVEMIRTRPKTFEQLCFLFYS